WGICIGTGSPPHSAQTDCAPLLSDLIPVGGEWAVEVRRIDSLWTCHCCQYCCWHPVRFVSTCVSSYWHFFRCYCCHLRYYHRCASEWCWEVCALVGRCLNRPVLLSSMHCTPQ